MKILILVEGKWDKLFFEKVVQPLVKEEYHTEASIQTYQNSSKDFVQKQVSIFENKGKWALVSDHDSHRTQCLTAKRTEVQTLYKLPHIQSIYVVVREIEDWYSAGITREIAERLNISEWKDGMILGKDFFKKHPQYKDETDLRIEMLKGFSTEKAMELNPSFAYFMRKFKLVESETDNESSQIQTS